jgi:hypothetical protein
MAASSFQPQVLRFPTERIARDIWKSRIQESIGRILSLARAPGDIQDMHVTDPLTGHEVALSVGDFFVRLTVDGCDYYFDRLTGRFHGTGSAH